MPSSANQQHVARRVDPQARETLDLMGPTIAYVTPPDGPDDAPCIMRGTIPAGGFVPLHTHPDFETFIVVSGEAQGFAGGDDSALWVPLRPGDVFHVPGGARHAFRNPSQEPCVALLVSTTRLGRFFREVGTPVAAGKAPQPPSAATVRRFLEVSARYGHWNASPEENQRIGLPARC